MARITPRPPLSSPADTATYELDLGGSSVQLNIRHNTRAYMDSNQRRPPLEMNVLAAAIRTPFLIQFLY